MKVFIKYYSSIEKKLQSLVSSIKTWYQQQVLIWERKGGQKVENRRAKYVEQYIEKVQSIIEQFWKTLQGEAWNTSEKLLKKYSF